MSVMVKINDIIIRSGWNIRDEVISETIGLLAESIDANGLLNPIILNDRMELVAGYRRLCACKILNHESIKAYVKKFESSDYERLAHLDENLQTKSLSPKNLERALAERKIIWSAINETKIGRPTKDNKSSTSFEAETAQITGQNPNEIRRQIKRVEGASDAVRFAYETDKITKSHVDELVRLDEKTQDIALDKILKKGMGIAETRLLVLDLLAKAKAKACANIVEKLQEEKDKPKPSSKSNESKIEPAKTEKPDEGFCVIDDVDLEKIERTSLIKRTDNHVKTVNVLVGAVIKQEAWKDVDSDIIEAFTKDLTALLINLDVLKKVFGINYKPK